MLLPQLLLTSLDGAVPTVPSQQQQQASQAVVALPPWQLFQESSAPGGDVTCLVRGHCILLWLLPASEFQKASSSTVLEHCQPAPTCTRLCSDLALQPLTQLKAAAHVQMTVNQEVQCLLHAGRMTSASAMCRGTSATQYSSMMQLMVRLAAVCLAHYGNRGLHSQAAHALVVTC